MQAFANYSARGSFTQLNCPQGRGGHAGTTASLGPSCSDPLFYDVRTRVRQGWERGLFIASRSQVAEVVFVSPSTPALLIKDQTERGALELARTLSGHLGRRAAHRSGADVPVMDAGRLQHSCGSRPCSTAYPAQRPCTSLHSSMRVVGWSRESAARCRGGLNPCQASLLVQSQRLQPGASSLRHSGLGKAKP